MLPQRRKLFHCRMFLIPSIFLGLICGSELASVSAPQSSSDKRKSSDIGTFNNFEWQTWLLADTQTGSHGVDADSSTISRRITPKSVFVAPKLTQLINCSEGYYADNMGRCVKSVNVNQEAHRNFIVERLNNYFGSIPAEKNNDRSSGPLQLNIPLTPNVKSYHSTKVEKPDPMEIFSKNDSIMLPVRGEIRLDDEKRRQTEEGAAASEVSDDATPNEKMLFFRKNFSADDADKTDQKHNVMIPLAELLVKEPNGINLSSTEDYKVPVDTMQNISSVKRINESNVTGKDVPTETQNSTQVPTLVLLNHWLLAPTKLPNSDNPSLTQNDTVGHTDAQSNFTVANETSNVSVASSSAVPSTQESTTEVAPIVVDEHRDNETHSEDESKVTENPKLNDESQEIEVIYDEEEEDIDYPYVTNEPDEDESFEIEGEEILKHGEAGITIPTRNVDRVQRNQTANRNKTLDAQDRIIIRFNDTASQTNDEVDSNVSSQVSIDGDRILETTLLDMNTETLQTTTKLPELVQQSVKNAENNSKESFDRHLSESEVALSQSTRDTTISDNGPTEFHIASAENERNEELEAAPTSSELLLYELPEENPVTQIGEEKSNVEKRVVQENPKSTESDVPLIELGRTTMNLDSAEDHIRFPDNVRQPQQQNGHVRFPSNEANSIHGPTYKQRQQQHPVDDRSFYGSTSTKSSVPVHRKPVYYLTRSSWKPDRPQRDHVQTATSARRRPTTLLSFWSKMPLIRDPAIYPVDQVPSGDETADDRVQHRLLRASPSRRRSSYNTEISSENMTLAQK